MMVLIILDNMTYWALKISHRTESIRQKIEELACSYGSGLFLILNS